MVEDSPTIVFEAGTMGSKTKTVVSRFETLFRVIGKMSLVAGKI